ncbi:MAG: histidinol phosphate phosphatase domain-containing protein [bacterium]
MIDLHTHSFLSDGELIPSELIRRAEVKGYKVLGITDHVDTSNLDLIVPGLIKVCDRISKAQSIKVIPGVEVTHVPPQLIPDLVKEARSLGARLVVVHGETLVEPVAPGTNAAALDCEIDILAHPGLLTKEEALMAKERCILLEISARKGHSLTNGHVAKVAMEVGAQLVLDTDSHNEDDLISRDMAEKILKGAGLQEADISKIFGNAYKLADRILSTTFC